MLALFYRSAAFMCISVLLSACTRTTPDYKRATSQDSLQLADAEFLAAPLEEEIPDTIHYQHLLLHLTHNKPSEKWPVYGAVPPKGALLPYNRILAYYGNLSTPATGILGIPEKEMLTRLKAETARWQQADTTLRVLPALHYVAVSTQPAPGPSGKYRERMPAEQIEKVVTMTYQHNMLLFLDVQVGLSTLQEELPLLETYLRLPEVHLGIDPEYNIKGGEVSPMHIGTFDAADINYAISFLAGIVKRYQLPPKILVVHRFTQAMLTNYQQIKKVPEVQIVINMDDYGSPVKKTENYNGVVAREPVQYTGFKLFYKADPKMGKRMMEPEEVLSLYPSPVYIQYQ